MLKGILKTGCDRKKNVRHFVPFKLNTHKVQHIIYIQYFLLVWLCVCEGRKPAEGLVSSVPVSIQHDGHIQTVRQSMALL